jgi:hypothetical protein
MDSTAILDRAIVAIDRANAGDPNTLAFRGEVRPKELLHAELLTSWVRKLRPEAGDALLLAARAHHLRRWERPRADYPAGRHGYLRWRRDANQWHAEIAAPLLREAGYDEPTIERAAELIARRPPLSDPDRQALEDGVCLVFLETQLDEVAGRIAHDTMVDILRKSWRKMSEAGRQAALELAFSPAEAALVREALNGSEETA